MKLIECPRDAMQGFTAFIPTDVKTIYLNKLLGVGFDTLDFGSFVSPKAIPQMADTAEVLKGLDLSHTNTKLLSIVANKRGAEQAACFDEITYIGYPLSVSEIFQQRNTNKSIAEALEEIAQIHNHISESRKILVVYLSMAFGNPYDELYHPDRVSLLTEKLSDLGITIVAPSDTIGSSTPASIIELFQQLLQDFPHIEFGAHLHSTPSTVIAKIEAAYQAGCRRFDGAIRGFGGCPMAKDELTGNLPTEQIIGYFERQSIDPNINRSAFEDAWQYAAQVFALH
ncbi:hydroxymethylglutaryl-CoA lyase [Cytophagaceae bacterium YF14B1]|uniref:Hydroxymethylglutaryl-CoA lyase n=1 Tax=Xanthocytophaga flava TaxID=3048013 RepID=A0AAE3QLQ4_9BACT|nr:hydroxymethylglutaryl-CoA lyase [Xanthocytophaga flavus]MDJ1481632.1 hydroxymethylglutaryl-CoA lyase [Xanthocytophaga flavus]